MVIRRALLAILVLILLAGAGVAAIGWHAEIPPIPKPPRAAFDPAVIAHGAELAAIGDCALCHTQAGGKSYAGGFPVATPFGTVYGTNITPDSDTGIGNWSEAAFARALHDGIDRRGNHLYPAFPYDHFTLVTDADTQALYAYLMTRRPVRQETPPNRLIFPVNIRLLVAGWNLLFLHDARFQPDSTKTEAWNRGAYLAEGLGHCGACHTPRNLLGAENHDQEYDGGEGEGWHAPALNARSPAPVPWDEEALVAYLHSGIEPHHGVAAGPMASVTADLATAPDKDLRALAAYIAVWEGSPAPDRKQRADRLIAAAAGTEEATGAGGSTDDGALIYGATCASCHGNGFSASGERPALSFSTALSDSDARDAVHIVLEGIHPPEGAAGPLMPGFSGALTDPQLMQLLGHLRRELADKPPWTDIAATAREIRRAQEER
jgi:mono/diheme cytochrome c family protein